VVVALLTESLLVPPTVSSGGGDPLGFVVVSQKTVRVRRIVGLKGGEYVNTDMAVLPSTRTVV
jgi:hypothetical protein